MDRTASISRTTSETDIAVTLNLDGSGRSDIDTGIGFFDHMLISLSFYAGIRLELACKGDLHVDAHHTIEDCGIVLGQAIRASLGEKMGIKRFASEFIPMDEALAFCALDISGRPFLDFNADFPQEMIGDWPTCMCEEFFRAVAYNAGITLHMKLHAGRNAHHMTEALFKAFGGALKEAVRITGEGVMSTKGII